MMMNVIPWDGQKISAPGIYSGVPIEAYHGDLCAGPSVSSSGLRTIESKTPEHYYAGSYLNPDRIIEERKPSFDFGRAAHSYLIERRTFDERHPIRPPRWDSWRTKLAKEWRAEQEAAGKTVLTPAQFKRIDGIASALKRHPLIRQGLMDGLIEHTIVCQDSVTGVCLKIRPDVVPVADGVLVDFKTTTDASPEATNRAIRSYRYPMQGALSVVVMRKALGIAVTDFVLVFSEKEAPHSIAIVPIDNEWIYWAMREVRRAIDKFARCVERGEWPGYDTEAAAHMPEWLRKRYELEAEHGLLPEAEIAA